MIGHDGQGMFQKTPCCKRRDVVRHNLYGGDTRGDVGALTLLAGAGALVLGLILGLDFVVTLSSGAPVLLRALPVVAPSPPAGAGE